MKTRWIGARSLTVLLLALSVGGLALAEAEKHEHEEAGPAEHEQHGEEGHAEGEEEGHAEDGEEHGEEGIVRLGPEALKAAALESATAAEHSFRRILRATGEIALDPDRVARVGPRIAGRIASLKGKLGDTVQPGDVLAQLDSVELGRAKSEFLGRKAKLALARTNYEREKRLQGKGISSEKELLEAEAGQTEAQVEVDAADVTLHVLGLTETEIRALNSGEHDLSGFNLRAPLAGKVIEREAALGQMAEPSTTLFVIADLAEVWARVDIQQKDLGSVRVGASVQILLDAYPDQPLQATIRLVGAALDETTRTVQAVAVLKNPEGKLLPGMFLKAAIEGQEGSAEKTLAIPDAALQRLGEETVVFVVEGEGRFARREVRVGRISGGQAEILAGLEPGSRVVTQGSFLLKSELSKSEMGHGHSH